MKTSDIGATVKVILAALQQSFELCLGDTIDDDGHTGSQRIPQILLQCIEMLMEYLPATDPYAIEVCCFGGQSILI